MNIKVTDKFVLRIPFLLSTFLIIGISSNLAAQDKKADESHRQMLIEEAYPSATTCKTCHPAHYEEWAVSAHAYAQMSPVFNAMHATIVKATNGTNGDFCIRCHTPIGMNIEEPIFMSNLDRNRSSLEGITCITCHRVDREFGKISGRLALLKGNINAPVFGTRGNDNLQQALDEGVYNIQPVTGEPGRPVHSEAKAFDYLGTSGFCGSCHDVNLFNGFRLEEAFSDYKTSPASAEGITCQDCHMGKVPGKFVGRGNDPHRDANYDWAPAANVGGRETPARKRTNHMFAGPDYSIIHPGIFPHNVEAQKLATLREWLQFDHKAGWGTPAFENKIADGEEFPIYQLTPQSIEKLRENNIPAEILQRLQPLVTDKIMTESEFVQVLGKAGETATGQYKSSLLRYSEFRWATRDDRVEGRDLINKNLELLAEIDRQRDQVLRAGYVLSDIVVDKANEKGIKFKIGVHNGTNGHSTPTGFDAERLVYLQITITDRTGKVVYVSGDTDPNGDVRDLHSLYVHDGKLPQDKDLFSLQSRFVVRMVRGGEREQVLAVNYSPDPLPFIRPSTRSTLLLGRPVGARKHRQVIKPLDTVWPEYKISKKALRGSEGPYELEVKLIAQMIPVNLLFEIKDVGFDYNMSPREIADAVVEGKQILYESKIVLEKGRFTKDQLWSSTVE